MAQTCFSTSVCAAVLSSRSAAPLTLALFRRSTEQTLGGLEAFTPYIQSYVATFAGQSITTQQWLDHLYTFWRDAGGEAAVKKLDSVDFNAWLHGEALDIPVDVKYDTSLVDQVRSLLRRRSWPVLNAARPKANSVFCVITLFQAYELAVAWTEASKASSFGRFKKSDLTPLITDQIVVFLEKLEVDRALSVEAVKAMDEVYSLSTAGNAELSWRFFQVRPFKAIRPRRHALTSSLPCRSRSAPDPRTPSRLPPG